MKTKIIILSYYSLPGNFAASYRIESWLKHLAKFDIHPILITRHWDKGDIDFTAISLVQERTVEETDLYSIIRLPYKGSLRDKLVNRYGSKISFLWKPISFFQLILQNYFFELSPYSNLKKEVEEILNTDPQVQVILTSGNPFLQFGFCHDIRKKFPSVRWIADYRDPWNSNSNISSSLNLRILRFFERSREKLWIKNASAITTVSDGVAKGIQGIIGTEKQVKIVHNGFNSYHQAHRKSENQGVHIGYIGTLYPQQKIEVFLHGLVMADKKFPAQRTIHFFGLKAQPDQVLRITKFASELSMTQFIFYAKKPKEELLELASNCQAFLLCGIPERKGTYTAKLFDYFALQRPIMLSPGDDDILNETINKSNTGIVLNTPAQVSHFLSFFNAEIKYNPNKEMVDQFRTENQVKKMADIIHRFAIK